MKETKSKGDHRTYRHFTDSDYNAIKEIQRQYEAQAKRTWFQIADMCRGKFLLTVEEVEI